MRRRSARYKSLLNGVISTKADVLYASCVVTDVSAVGAKLIIMGRTNNTRRLRSAYRVAANPSRLPDHTQVSGRHWRSISAT
jgi:hypothetical protein